MPLRGESKHARLESYLAARRPDCIDESIWEELRKHLAPVSDGYLRQLLKAAGLPMAPVVEGVRQDSLDEAARTLIGLAHLYALSDAAGRKRVRAVVITSKDRIRWALKRLAGARNQDTERSALKEEILLWTVTWLENPEIFEVWLTLRRAVAPHAEPIGPGSSPP
jgi:hypothetical protein